MGLFVGGGLVLADVDAERADALAAAGLLAQAVVQGLGAVVRETVGVHHGVELGVTEHAGLLVAGLGLGRDGADFDVAEAEGGRAAPAEAVLVEAGGEADVVGELQAEGFDRAAALGGQRALHQQAEGGAGAEQAHAAQADLVGRLGVELVEGLGDHLVVQERHAPELREERPEGKRRSPPSGAAADPS